MFKTMTGVLDPKKNPKPEDIKKIPSYIFCRWLSGNPFAIQAANQINLYSDIPIDNQYQMIKSAFGGKIKYIPYPKKESQNTLKQTEFLAKHYNISLEKAQECLEFIDPKELKEIVEMYTEMELRHGK